MQCQGLCPYYEHYSGFAKNRSYEDFKHCSVCGHVVPRIDFECERCYCCNARYRIVGRYNKNRNRELKSKRMSNPLIQHVLQHI